MHPVQDIYYSEPPGTGHGSIGPAVFFFFSVFLGSFETRYVSTYQDLVCTARLGLSTSVQTGVVPVRALTGTLLLHEIVNL